ncbi:Unknown protein, partial [Striga hermonthica]
FSLVVSPSSSHPYEWILDSGCTHISPIWDWFFNFQESNGGVVYMGNDNACKTTGIGSIHLKNRDGSTRVLTDVRYVPSLKKNLISLGALESKGLVVTLRDGVMKATSGSLVVMKDIRRNNLYYYEGDTVVGTVTVADSTNKESEAVKLWHMRLGHAGGNSNFSTENPSSDSPSNIQPCSQENHIEKVGHISAGSGVHTQKGTTTSIENQPDPTMMVLQPPEKELAASLSIIQLTRSSDNGVLQANYQGPNMELESTPNLHTLTENAENSVVDIAKRKGWRRKSNALVGKAITTISPCINQEELIPRRRKKNLA